MEEEIKQKIDYEPTVVQLDEQTIEVTKIVPQKVEVNSYDKDFLTNQIALITEDRDRYVEQRNKELDEVNRLLDNFKE